MASIRERIETIFAALAFAEQNLTEEARGILGNAQEKKAPTASTAKRADNRPRLRV